MNRNSMAATTTIFHAKAADLIRMAEAWAEDYFEVPAADVRIHYGVSQAVIVDGSFQEPRVITGYETEVTGRYVM